MVHQRPRRTLKQARAALERADSQIRITGRATDTEMALYEALRGVLLDVVGTKGI